MDPNVFDQEVYSYIEDHLPIIVDPSVRHYRNAIKLKQGGLDWKDTLLESFGLTSDRLLVLKLRQNTTLRESDRSREFARITGKVERTYYRVVAYLRAAGIKFER